MQEERVLGGRMRPLRSILSLRYWTSEDVKSQGGNLRVVRAHVGIICTEEKVEMGV